MGVDGVRLEYAVPWVDLGMTPGQPFAFHVTASDKELKSDRDVSETARNWDNLGGAAGGPGSTRFHCHSIEFDSESFAVPGTSATHAYRVRNLGNAPSSYDLHATSSLGFELRLHADVDGDGLVSAADHVLAVDDDGDGSWEVTPAPQAANQVANTGSLGGSQGITSGVFDVILEVLVPADAEWSVSDTARLFATCNETGLQEEVKGITHVGGVVAYSSSERSAEPGLTVPHRHVVVNATGVAQSFDVVVSSSEGWPRRAVARSHL